MRSDPPHFKRTDIWREGKWLDLWSVVHFLSGVSLGLGLAVFHFGAGATILIAFLLIVGYELWEAMVKIEETPQNRFMDVVVGMTSFVPAYFFGIGLIFSQLVALFIPVLTVNIVMATLGWLESRKAAALEARLRQRYGRQKKRFDLERTRLRAYMRRTGVRNEPEKSLSDEASF